MIKNPNTASIAERGYEVQPAANGGFVLYLGNARNNNMNGTMGDFYAFSHAEDLALFICEQHGLKLEEVGRPA